MNPYRILIVEDEAIVAMDIESRLTAMGYAIAGRAASAEQALALAKEAQPDLILMDIRLQGEMDGIDAALEIHKYFRIPVIFVTAYSEETTLERAKLAEPFGYILKPFDDRELKSAIEIALYKHRTEQEILQMSRLYAVLSHVNEAIIHIATRDELFQAVCRVVVGYGEVDLAWVGWLERESGRIMPVAWFGEESEMLSQADFYADHQPEGEGNPGRAIREARPVICNDCGAAECSFPAEKVPSRFGFQSCASFPLWLKGEVRGVLNLCVSGSAFFKTAEIDLLGEVAADLSFALDKIEGDRQRQQAEAQLRKLSAAVEQTPAVVVITDPSARIEYVNPAFTRITGYTMEEALGKNPSLLKSGETPDEVYHDLWQTITSGREWRGILHNRRKDGTMFWERVVISAVRDEMGKTTSYIAVKEDITEQKAMEDQLHQAQKMESIGRLAGGVAHDFNNMLMVISGYAELLLLQTESDDPRYHGLHEIMDAARRSANLTRQLLAFARKQPVAPVVLDMNDTIEGMLKMLRRLIGEDIELAWLPGSELWKVRIDPSQIDQLLANLAVNARDAIAGVGTVTIKTENVTLDAASCSQHSGCTPGEHVGLVVGDTGIGMDREVVAHIFEPFFTTKEAGKGTGLGLATVYGIIKQNLGCVNVESEPGRGTTFRVHLPRFVEEAKADLAASDQEEALPMGTETVLLVEDEEAILNLGRQFIERLGYKVLAANSPEEAMRLAEGYGDVIQLLITDIVMPQMNGKDLAERLRQRFPGLKCLFMSGYSVDIIARQGILEEGIHFLQKPFALRDIAFKARKALEG